MFIDKLEEYHKEGLLIKQSHTSLPIHIWNYSQKVQYEELWDDITLQCRGLVTDKDGNILARPFKKFFNLEEGKHKGSDKFDVYEKVDGSLIIAFKMWGVWVVASRGSFTSEQAIAAHNLFHNKYGSNNMLDEATYLFEYTSPWNRIVVDYGQEEKLTLLGSIVTETGFEAPYCHLEVVAEQNGFNLVKKYDGINEYSELKSKIKDDEEGFVIRFSNGDRIKIKGHEYLRLHKIMTNVSTRSIWSELSNNNNLDHLLKDVPDEFFDKVKEYENTLRTKFNDTKKHYTTTFKMAQKLGLDKDRKSFASFAKEYRHPSILFRMLDDNDVNSYIWKVIEPEFERL